MKLVYFQLITLLSLTIGCTENDLSLAPQCELVSVGTDTLTYLNNRWTGGSDAFGKYSNIYDGDGRLREKSYQNQSVLYSYDNMNRIVTVDFVVGGQTNQKDYYTYNSQSQIIMHNTHLPYTLSGYDSLAYVYQYANSSSSNYISSTLTGYNKKVQIGASAHLTYEYDDKINPYSLLWIHQPKYNTSNNITKITSTTTTTTVTSNSYTYDSKDHPLTQVTTYSWKTGSTTENFAYSNCQ